MISGAKVVNLISYKQSSKNEGAQNSMRPIAVIWFEILFLVTIALSLVKSALSWEALFQIGIPTTAIVISIGIYVLKLVLVLLISRRRSQLALLFLIAIVLLPAASSLLNGLQEVFLFIITGVQLIAIALLFFPASRLWLKAKGSEGQPKNIYS